MFSAPLSGRPEAPAPALKGTQSDALFRMKSRAGTDVAQLDRWIDAVLDAASLDTVFGASH